MLKLRWYQQEAVDAVFDYLLSHRGNCLVAMPTGCHAKGTQILMYDGTTRAVETIKVGDLLMGPDSQPRKVLRLAHGHENMYRVQPVKGNSFIVNENHILSLQSTNEGKAFTCKTTGCEIANVTVKEWISWPKNRKHLYKLRRVGVDFPERNKPLLDPWMMGAFLGDGSLLTGCNITSADKEIVEEVHNIAETFNLMVRVSEKTNNKAKIYNLVSPFANRAVENPLTAIFRYYGLYGTTSENKYIPIDYKAGSREVRLQVLAGLIDTDGHLCDSGSVDFISKSEWLANDVAFVARSLGFAAYVKSCMKASQTGFQGSYYRVSISGDLSLIPNKLERKKAKPRLQKKSVLKTGFKVEYIGPGDFYGFALSDDHLYLTEDFTVHHNTGKALVIAAIIERAIAMVPGTRIVNAIHVKELVKQNAEEFLGLQPGAPVGMCCAGLRRNDTHLPITFGSIGTLIGQADALGVVHILIIDEAHLLSPQSSSTYQKFIAILREKNPHLRVIGLSATPYRQGLGLLTNGDIFDEIVYDITGMEQFNRLIAEGFLAPLVTRPTIAQIDTSGIGMSHGEFNQNELEAAVDKDSITHAALSEVCQYGWNRRAWIIFASGRDHAEHCAEKLRSFGVSAEAVYTGLKGKERDRRIEAFKRGELRAIVSMNVLTTGFNHRPVDLIGMLRPTMSTGLWVQMAGRGTRPFEGKRDCLMLDFAGNIRRLGPINDPVIPKKRKPGDPGEMPVKICEGCGCYNHTRATVCEVCGAEFHFQTRIETSASTAEILRSDLPTTEWFEVNRVIYSTHQKPGKPPTMRVIYHSRLNQFSEWVCFEHDGFAGKKARDWWRERTSVDNTPPSTVFEALQRKDELTIPKQIRVWTNKQPHPEVLSYSFTGELENV